VFRGQVKRLELESEKIEQQVLEHLNVSTIGVPASSRIEAAEANLSAYGDYLGNLPAEALAIILEGFVESGAHPAPAAGL